MKQLIPPLKPYDRVEIIYFEDGYRVDISRRQYNVDRAQDMTSTHEFKDINSVLTFIREIEHGILITYPDK